MSASRRPARPARLALRTLAVAGMGTGLWLAGQAAASAQEPATSLLGGVTQQVTAPAEQVTAPAVPVA
ncbi:hypothetical protein, partial [Klenkia sp. PcliD-1-E]|uniref:hypothetical protein n=1 Tax=Klenkia sp. PcliD-1-E TaxID=2954492 RepID=UPI002096E83B